MRTIESFDDYVDPIQEAIDDLLLPTLFGQTEPLPSDLRQLVTLTPAQGGLDVPDLRFEAPQQFAASTSITAPYVDSITTQSMFMVAGENSTEELKRQHQALKTASLKLRMENSDSTLPSDQLRSVNQSRDKGASSWLTAVPLVDQGVVLNKQEFRDSPRLGYNMPLSDLPSKCVFGEKYTVCHALSCKKGGFHLRRAVTSPKARLDFKAGAFGLVELQHFFDVTVTNVNSKCNQGKATSTFFKEHEEEKKRKYQQRVLDVEMGSFTTLTWRAGYCDPKYPARQVIFLGINF